MQLEHAAKQIPEAANGVYIITSSEQLDAFLKLYADKVVVLLSGLSWCRPCKSLTRPLEKLAAHYEDGAVFIKVMGDTNNSTKRLFKNRLQVLVQSHSASASHTPGVSVTQNHV
jgi:thioredoxin-like negative regulator of GroEL